MVVGRNWAPIADEDMEDFCCIVAGNKADLVVGNVGRHEEALVTEERQVSCGS